MRTRTKFPATLILTITMIVLSGTSLVYAYLGNTFVTGRLRTNQSGVYNAKNYRVMIKANSLPTTEDPYDFTSGWLSVHLAQYIEGVAYSGQFTQVGIIAKPSGVRWFVYTEAGMPGESTITCLEGDNAYPGFCWGDYNEIVSEGTWHWVRLYRNADGYWYVRVYYENGASELVAKILHESTRIYYASVEAEEGYDADSDPFLQMDFYFYHPQYYYAGWKDWNQSTSTGKSYIITQIVHDDPPHTICPNHYGAIPNLIFNLEIDERYWFAGTLRPNEPLVCNWLLFPREHVQLPIISR